VRFHASFVKWFNSLTGIVFFPRGQIFPDLFVSVLFWREPRAKTGQKKMVRAKSGHKKKIVRAKSGQKKGFVITELDRININHTDTTTGLIAMGGPNLTFHLDLKNQPYHNQPSGASSGNESAVEQKRRLCLW
jgi:hypothetical protein